MPRLFSFAELRRLRLVPGFPAALARRDLDPRLHDVALLDLVDALLQLARAEIVAELRTLGLRLLGLPKLRRLDGVLALGQLRRLRRLLRLRLGHGDRWLDRAVPRALRPAHGARGIDLVMDAVDRHRPRRHQGLRARVVELRVARLARDPVLQRANLVLVHRARLANKQTQKQKSARAVSFLFHSFFLFSSSACVGRTHVCFRSTHGVFSFSLPTPSDSFSFSAARAPRLPAGLAALAAIDANVEVARAAIEDVALVGDGLLANVALDLRSLCFSSLSCLYCLYFSFFFLSVLFLFFSLFFQTEKAMGLGLGSRRHMHLHQDHRVGALLALALHGRKVRSRSWSQTGSNERLWILAGCCRPI